MTILKNLFLCSSFSDVSKKFENYIERFPLDRTLTFIPTASLVEDVDFFVNDAIQVFDALNFKIDILDISRASKSDIKKIIQHNNFIYLSGGNSFFLLENLKSSNTDLEIIKQVKNGKIYIGESAGAIVTSKNIEYISLLDDKNKATLLNSYNALNLLPYYPLPHYKEIPFDRETTKIFDDYNKTIDVIPLRNEDVLVVDEISSKIF
ncbi:Type 1 glutamine amidotransferase-like domain-containing protein (plasmid) [Enterococcus alishanensis]